MGEDGLPPRSAVEYKVQQESQKYFPAQLLQGRELLQDAGGTLDAWQDISQIHRWGSRVTWLLSITAASNKETHLISFPELIKKLRKCVWCIKLKSRMEKADLP